MGPRAHRTGACLIDGIQSEMVRKKGERPDAPLTRPAPLSHDAPPPPLDRQGIGRSWCRPYPCGRADTALNDGRRARLRTPGGVPLKRERLWNRAHPAPAKSQPVQTWLGCER
ncbi:hypothetical protein GCM10009827_022840 [Dactylosporangium maewongense]|uniref:Uncharacterized protein n=1 Tax=Dactylosporangium maewongense TaxID=634393 RepID=A0ABN1ZZX6_9ACTN